MSSTTKVLVVVNFIKSNFLSALLAILGTSIFFIFGEIIESSSLYFLPIAAGGFIYIAVADLIPELQKTKEAKHSLSQMLAITVGVLVMVLLTYLE